MSDTAVATMVSGVITVATMGIGFLTLWVKLKYAAKAAEVAAQKASSVEHKIDDNTAISKAGATSAAVTAAETTEKMGLLRKIDQQTNGGLKVVIAEAISPLQNSIDAMAMTIANNDKRISIVESYSHESKHALANAVNALSLKIELLSKQRHDSNG